MNKAIRKELQLKRETMLRTKRQKQTFITKQDTLNERAKKLHIATDMPAINRQRRREDLKVAVRKEL